MDIPRSLTSNLPTRQYSPEEIEAVRKRIEINNATCLPDCELCGGIGYVRYSGLQPDDERFGKSLPCPNRQKAVLVSGNERYGLSKSEVASLSWTHITSFNDGPRAAKAAQSALQSGFGLVYLYGPAGQAKTLALKIAVASSLRTGIESAYTNMVDILDDLRAAYSDKEAPMMEIVRRMDWWSSLKVLAIDELDKVKLSDWALERIHQLIDRRWVQAVRGETVTLIASNSGPDNLGEYIASRIHDNRFEEYFIRLEGKDGRTFAPKSSTW